MLEHFQRECFCKNFKLGSLIYLNWRVLKDIYIYIKLADATIVSYFAFLNLTSEITILNVLLIPGILCYLFSL